MYGDTKKLISIRVDSGLYEKIKKDLDKKNAKRTRWSAYTFTEIVDQAMLDYVKKNNL